MEGAYAIKYNQAAQNFSSQQLLDCSANFGNEGCMGGLMTNCFSYLLYYKLMTWASYPYVGYA